MKRLKSKKFKQNFGKKKLWEKELKVSYSRKAHKHIKIEAELKREFKKQKTAK